MDRRSVLLALAGASLAPAALAQAPFAGGPLGPGQYRTAALQGGEFAIQTSRLALERATNPRVQEFAQLEINEQIAFAASLGAAPGSVPMRPDQAQVVQQLQAARGARFDAAYVQGQIAGHEELLALNTAYVQSGGDSLGRAVANVAIPSIQTHLTILSRLRRG